MAMKVLTFDEFVVQHYERIVRVLTLAGGDLPAAEDAVQEAFARALTRWRRVSELERPDGWVYVTAMNVLRRRGRLREVPLEETVEGVDDSLAGAVVTRVVLGQALHRLPARQRQVIVLRYVADLSTAEVAVAMRCAEGTVKSTLHQALVNLRVSMEDGDA